MNPKSLEARIRNDDPFEGMVITDSTALNSLSGRSPCPQCGKSRMYFCYTCYVPILKLKNVIPCCKLPVKVDIIKHRREIDGKSTAAHAAILAPEDVTIYTYPNVPNYKLDGTTVLLYPSTEAVNVRNLFKKSKRDISYCDQLLAQLPPGYNIGTLMSKIFPHTDTTDQEIFHVEEFPIKRVILIDSTWNQSRGIFADKRLQDIPKIVLQDRVSQFWRHQKGSPRWYLSTIEALHQLLLELHIAAWGRHKQYKSYLLTQSPVHDDLGSHCQCSPYNGQYDNLLFFFKHMYGKIHSLYKHDDMLAYKRPMAL